MECPSQSSALTSLPEVAKSKQVNFVSEVAATQVISKSCEPIVHALQAETLLQLENLSQFTTTIAI